MTNDAVPVTAEDREAAANYLRDHGYWHIDPEEFRSGEKDDSPLVQAFARHRGSTAVVDALERLSKLTAFSANAATVEDFAATVHAIADTALASLSQTPATPMVQEGLREALAEAYRKGATDVHNYWVNNPGEPPQGDPEFGESASDYASAALDIFDSSARALSATPAQEGEQ